MTARVWVQTWLAAVRERRADRRTPAVLRQCTWCQNGLHTRCTGTARRLNLEPITCLCPCATAAGHRLVIPPPPVT